MFCMCICKYLFRNATIKIILHMQILSKGKKGNSKKHSD